MGCDYYIYIYLEIEHKNGISYCEFPIIRGYYPEIECFLEDSDYENDENDDLEIFNSMCKTLVNFCLTPKKDIVIYENNSFKSEKIKNKYIQIIKDKINNNYKNTRLTDTGVLTNINEIIKITKKEIRDER
jgi:hypothetical protein